MNRAKNTGLVLCGLVLGLSLSAPAAQAVESLKATLSTNRILVDGQEVRLTAYNINGNNYVMLRDIGRAVGFNIYWDSDSKCVQVESDKPYTGEAPVKSTTTKPVEQPAQTDVAAAKQLQFHHVFSQHLSGFGGGIGDDYGLRAAEGGDELIFQNGDIVVADDFVHNGFLCIHVEIVAGTPGSTGLGGHLKPAGEDGLILFRHGGLSGKALPDLSLIHI